MCEQKRNIQGIDHYTVWVVCDQKRKIQVHTIILSECMARKGRHRSTPLHTLCECDQNRKVHTGQHYYILDICPQFFFFFFSLSLSLSLRPAETFSLKKIHHLPLCFSPCCFRFCCLCFLPYLLFHYFVFVFLFCFWGTSLSQISILTAYCILL